MKYKFKQPVVEVTRIIQSGLPLINGVQPVLGNYIFTDPLGEKRLITTEELLRTFLPADGSAKDPKTIELLLSAQGIIDLATMLDDENAEELLFDAIEFARKIIRLLG
jgi:hypothetical protein